MQTLRLGDYQGVRYDVTSHSDDFEIYNVVTDPGQRQNLASDPKFARLQQQMKDKVLGLRRPDSSSTRPYDKEFVPAVAVDSLKPGLEWFAYRGAFPWVPELTTLSSSSSGVTKLPTIAVLPRKDNAGLLFTGYLSVPTQGEYTFYLTADTGALLRIHEATVVDADFGYSGGTEKSGTIRLKAGSHPFRFYYARGTNGVPQLNLSWSGPEIAKQPVPDSVFSHGGTAPQSDSIR
jgi:hypothetical protein